MNGVATHSTIGPLLVKALVAGGADVNKLAVDRLAFTPLHLACHQGACGGVLQALLDAGADMRTPCAGIGFTSPLLLAALSGGNPETVRVMINQPQSGGLNAMDPHAR